MDPLTGFGLAVNIATVIDLAIKVYSKYQELHDSSKPSRWEGTFKKLPAFYAFLRCLRDEADSGRDFAIELRPVLDDCGQLLEKINEIIASIDKGPTPGCMQRVSIAFFSMKHDAEFESILKDLDRCMQLIQTIKIIEISQRNPWLSSSTTPAMRRHYGSRPLVAERFFGRRLLLDKMENELRTYGKGQDPRRGTPKIILHGMGGQGKTQIALEISERLLKSRQVQTVVWLDVTSEATLKTSLSIVAMQIDEKNRIIQDLKLRIQNARKALEEWTHPWLLVLDNYNNPDTFKDMWTYVPDSSRVMAIVTTRLSNLDGYRLAVDALEDEDARALFCYQSGTEETTENLPLLQEVVRKLGNFALAIDLAGSFMQRRSLSLLNFVAEFESIEGKILGDPSILPHGFKYHKIDPTFVDSSLQTNDYAELQRKPFTVMASWAISAESLREPRGLKLDVLTLCACLDYTKVSENFLQARCFPNDLDEFRLALRSNPLGRPQWSELFLDDSGAWSHSKFQDFLEEMYGLSLARSQDDRCISLHPLIADWLRFRDSSLCKTALQDAAIAIQCYWDQRSLLTETFVPEPTMKLQEALELKVHIERLESSILSYQNTKSESAPSLLLGGHMLEDAGLAIVDFWGHYGESKRTKQLTDRATKSLETRLGSTSQYVFLARRFYGGKNNEIDDAIKTAQVKWTGLCDCLGPDHTFSLVAESELVYIQQMKFFAWSRAKRIRDVSEHILSPNAKGPKTSRTQQLSFTVLLHQVLDRLQTHASESSHMRLKTLARDLEAASLGDGRIYFGLVGAYAIICLSMWHLPEAQTAINLEIEHLRATLGDHNDSTYGCIDILARVLERIGNPSSLSTANQLRKATFEGRRNLDHSIFVSNMSMSAFCRCRNYRNLNMGEEAEAVTLDMLKHFEDQQMEIGTAMGPYLLYELSISLGEQGKHDEAVAAAKRFHGAICKTYSEDSGDYHRACVFLHRVEFEAATSKYYISCECTRKEIHRAGLAVREATYRAFDWRAAKHGDVDPLTFVLTIDDFAEVIDTAIYNSLRWQFVLATYCLATLNASHRVDCRCLSDLADFLQHRASLKRSGSLYTRLWRGILHLRNRVLQDKHVLVAKARLQLAKGLELGDPERLECGSKAVTFYQQFWGGKLDNESLSARRRWILDRWRTATPGSQERKDAIREMKDLVHSLDPELDLTLFEPYLARQALAAMLRRSGGPVSALRGSWMRWHSMKKFERVPRKRTAKAEAKAWPGCKCDVKVTETEADYEWLEPSSFPGFWSSEELEDLHIRLKPVYQRLREKEKSGDAEVLSEHEVEELLRKDVKESLQESWNAGITKELVERCQLKFVTVEELVDSFEAKLKEEDDNDWY